MRPTEILSNEHRVIEIALSCLERIVSKAAEDRKLDRESAEQVVDVIRNFADGCHHGKEENHLFTMLAERGMPAQGGPVGQMLIEHEQGRAFVKGMAENIEAAAAGDPAALANYKNNALGYVALLKAHIQKEDRVLFPMADRLLSDEDQAALLSTFETVETEHMGKGTHDKYLRMVQQLAEKWGVAHDAVKNHQCGCGH